MKNLTEQLLMKSKNALQKETVIIDRNYTDAADICNSFFSKFEQQYSGCFVYGHVKNNSYTSSRKVTSIIYIKDINTIYRVIEPDRILGKDSGYDAYISSGASIDLYFTTWDTDKNELLSKSNIVSLFSDTTATNYTLSSDFYNNFVYPKTIGITEYILICVPENCKTQFAYINRIFACNISSAQIDTKNFRRYNNQVRPIEQSYDMNVDNNEKILFSLLNIDVFKEALNI